MQLTPCPQLFSVPSAVKVLVLVVTPLRRGLRWRVWSEIKNSNRFPISFSGAGAAQSFSFMQDFAVVADAFAAFGADNPIAFVAGKLFRRQINFHPLSIKQLVIVHFLVGKHLLLVFA